MTKKQLKALRDYVAERARESSSKSDGYNFGAYLHYGRSLAYKDILNRLPTFKEGK